MPFTNRNNNSSQRAGRGLGPCGAGMAKGRGAGNRQGAGRGQGMGRGMGMRRRDGSCGFMKGQQDAPEQYTNDLEKRIADLEAENRKLKAEANK